MMFIEEKLYALISTVADHVYQGAAPANYGTPCVVLTRINTRPCRNIDDDLSDSAFVTFQVSTFATKMLDARRLSKTVRQLLREWDDPDVDVSYLTSNAMVDNTTETRLYHIAERFDIFCLD